MAKLLIDVIDAASTLGQTSRVQIIPFSTYSNPRVHIEDNEGKEAIKQKIDDFEYQYSNTEVSNALRKANESLVRNSRTVAGQIQVPQCVILFTDGQPDQPNKTEAMLKSLMDRGVYVTIIGKYMYLQRS